MASHRHARRLAFGAFSLALVAVTPAITAHAAPNPGWRVVYSHHYGSTGAFSTFWSASATGTRNAWAVGGETSNGAPGSGRPFAVRWRAGRWRTSQLPRGLTSYLFAVSADSASDAWAVSGQGGYVLHWNGSSWSVAKRFPESGLTRQITGVTAFQPSDVWVFGGSGAFPGVGTWHLHGKRWTKVTGNGGNIAWASALSRSDMWAVGGINAGQDAIMHYSGGKWLHATGKALKGLQFAGIVALSKGNVWAAAGSFLVHRTRAGWVRVHLPWAVEPSRLSSDGHGGIWATASSGKKTWLVHRTASGRWSRFALPGGSFAAGLSLIPGTRSLWATGSLAQQAGSKAAIWAFGRIG
jgi:hypothetical protein